MEVLEMMLKDNDKAMSVLAENINNMIGVAEIIHEFEGEEYVFMKRKVKIEPLLSQKAMMMGQLIERNPVPRTLNYLCNKCHGYFPSVDYKPLCEKCKGEK